MIEENHPINETEPNIVLARIKGKLVLVDGYHRVLATQKLGKIEIDADFAQCKDLNEAYKLALESNTRHGQDLSPEEIAKGIARLRKSGETYGAISKVVNMSIEQIKKIETERIIWKGGTKSFVVLKNLVKDTAGSETTEDDQKIYISRTQISLLDQLIKLVEDGFIDYKNKEVQKRLEHLSELLGHIVAR